VSGQPSPWRAGGEAMRLRAWRDADVAAVASALRAAVLGWCAGWGLESGIAETSCAPVADAQPLHSWQLLGGCATARAWISCGEEFQGRVTHALWGEPVGEAVIARAIAGRCQVDLESRLRASLQLEAAAQGAEFPPLCDAWSGALQASLPWGVALWLDADAVAKVLQAQLRPAQKPASLPPVESLLEAMAPQLLQLQVHLADVELELGEVQGLRVGDVVRVNHSLHAPLQVREPQGSVLFNASLARNGGRRAVELEPLARAGSSGGV
jgi:hypothetical protein